MVKQIFKDLDLEGDVVARRRRYHGKSSIVIDPQRAFGQPVAAHSCVPRTALAEAVAAEGSVARVWAIYEVERVSVQHAVRFHQELKAA